MRTQSSEIIMSTLSWSLYMDWRHEGKYGSIVKQYVFLLHHNKAVKYSLRKETHGAMMSCIPSLTIPDLPFKIQPFHLP